MQQIERYGVIALVFLLVTIVAVSFWSDDEEGGLWSRLRGEQPAAAEAAARRDPTGRASQARRSLGEDLPLTANAARGQRRTLQAPPAQGSAGTRGGQSSAQRPTLQGGTPGGRRNGAATLAQRPQNNAAPAAASPTSLAQRPAQPARPVAQPIQQPAQQPTAAAQRPVLPERSPERLAERVPALREDPRPTTTAARPDVHVVQAGESLSVIAEKRLGTAKRWKEIQDLNGGLDPRQLHVGMKLKLPGAGSDAALAARPTTAPQPVAAPAAAPKPAAAPAVAAGGATHVVQRGETLSEIALARLGKAGRWREIAALNPKANPDRLIVGAKLALPQDALAERREPLVAAADPAPAADRELPESTRRPRVR